jgi:hypothetical protein
MPGGGWGRYRPKPAIQSLTSCCNAARQSGHLCITQPHWVKLVYWPLTSLSRHSQGLHRTTVSSLNRAKNYKNSDRYSKLGQFSFLRPSHLDDPYPKFNGLHPPNADFANGSGLALGQPPSVSRSNSI